MTILDKAIALKTNQENNDAVAAIASNLTNIDMMIKAREKEISVLKKAKAEHEKLAAVETGADVDSDAVNESFEKVKDMHYDRNGRKWK